MVSVDVKHHVYLLTSCLPAALSVLLYLPLVPITWLAFICPPGVCSSVRLSSCLLYLGIPNDIHAGLSVCFPSVCLVYTYLRVCLGISVCPPACPIICFACGSVCLWMARLSVYLAACILRLSLCLSTLYVCINICLSACLPANCLYPCLSACLSTCLSAYMPTCQLSTPVCLSAYVSVCLHTRDCPSPYLSDSECVPAYLSDSERVSACLNDVCQCRFAVRDGFPPACLQCADCLVYQFIHLAV